MRVKRSVGIAHRGKSVMVARFFTKLVSHIYLAEVLGAVWANVKTGSGLVIACRAVGNVAGEGLLVRALVL
jgi:hypothetical protein